MWKVKRDGTSKRVEDMSTLEFILSSINTLLLFFVSLGIIFALYTIWQLLRLFV